MTIFCIEYSLMSLIILGCSWLGVRHQYNADVGPGSGTAETYNIGSSLRHAFDHNLNQA